MRNRRPSPRRRSAAFRPPRAVTDPGAVGWDGVTEEGNVVDVIYAGGDIVTAGDDRPTAEAVAVRNGRNSAVGSLARVRESAGAGARTVGRRAS